ncbi:MAG: hypothetical protein Tsb0013_24670 [Phycisphaerales bacterium]
MTETTFQRRLLSAFVAIGAMTAGLALTGCDQATDSSPQAKTTPASTSTTAEADPQTPAKAEPSKPTPTPAPANSATDTNTANDLRLQREREMQEQQGVQFSDDPSAQPRLVVSDNTVQHAGLIYAAEPVNFEFELRNAGTADLIINRISSSCGCTVPDKTGLVDVAFKPGETLPSLKVAYTPKGPGDSSKIVTLFTNDPAQPIVRLRVGAELAALAKAVPEDIRPGELRAGREHIVTFDIMSYDPEATIQTITIPKMEGLVEFRPQERVLIEDPDSEFKSRIPVQIVFPKTLDQQKIAATLQIDVLATPPGKSEAVKSPVVARLVANVTGDLRFTRPFARVQLVEAGKPYTFQTNLTTMSGTDFEITRVVAYDRKTQREIPLTVSYERLEQARVPTWRLTLEGTTPDAGPVNGELVVYTSLDNEPPAKMTFSGYLAPNRQTGTQPVQPRKNPNNVVRPNTTSGSQ